MGKEVDFKSELTLAKIAQGGGSIFLISFLHVPATLEYIHSDTSHIYGKLHMCVYHAFIQHHHLTNSRVIFILVNNI